MTDYKRFIHGLAINHVNRTFLNSDEGKMLDVFTEIFNRSQKEIRIFAGSLCNAATNNPEYIEALSDFIERGGRLIILLNSFNEDEAKKSNLYKRLAFYQTQKRDSVQIKITTAKPYIKANDIKQYIHIAIGDETSYRLETDTNARTAICNMSDPETAANYRRFFDNIWDTPANTTLDITAIFGNNN